jgi:MoaA/NifB/PqqE/SkfB family radical SAM enzyme
LTQPHGAYNTGMAQGILKAVRLWSHWNPRRIALLWNRYRIFQKANRRRAGIFQNDQILVPPLLILSVTMKCNLSCVGCYSREYPTHGELGWEGIDRLMTEAEELGVGFFVLTGGEPLLLPGLLDLLAKHRNLIFFLFTNGTRIDRDWAGSVAKMDNVIPLLSVEGSQSDTDSRRGAGTYEKVMTAMEYLAEADAFFGFSSMVSRKNFSLLGTDEFLDGMISRGCRMGYFVGYVPCGEKAPLDLVPEAGEQRWFRQRVRCFQENKRILLIHMPDDEYEIAGSCMAAARGFLHINAQGYVEPCPFAHFATDTVRAVSLREALQSPLFSYIRSRDYLLTKPHLGCALYENRKKLMAAAAGLGAISTEEQSSLLERQA